MKKKIIFGLILCAVLSVTGIYSVKDVKATGTYTTEQIKEYITAHEVPPTPEGKIFAGWYNGETPVKGTADVTDTTVPKFVDDDVLTVKFQLLAVTNSTSTTTDVRFLTSVDSLNYQSLKFKVELDEREMEEYFTTIVIANGRYYGSGYNIGPTSNLNDGVFELYLAPKMNKFKMLKLILKMKNGKHENSPLLEKHITNKVKIESEDIIVANIDGEEIADKEFDIELNQNGITVYHNDELIKPLKK